jgi:hypothetical protein
MNKTTAKIVYYSCFVIAAIISYQAIDYAGDVALSGRQPSLWLGIAAFMAAILLVGVAIYIKAKYKI